MHNLFILLYILSCFYIAVKNKSFAQPFGITEFTLVLYGIIFIVVPHFEDWSGYHTDIKFQLILISGLVGILLGHGFIHNIQRKKPILISYVPKQTVFVKFALISIILVYVSLNILVIARVMLDHGFVGAFLRDRVANRLAEYDEYSALGDLGWIISLMQPAFLIALGVIGKRSPAIVYAAFGVIIFTALLTAAHRNHVLFPILALVLYVHLCVKRIPLVGFAGLALIFLLLLASGNALRRGNLTAALDFRSDSFASGLRAFGTGEYFYEELYPAVNDGLLQLEYGRNIYYYFPLSFVPRAIWPGKPLVSVNARLTNFFSGRVGDGTIKSSIRTYTAWGEGYLQFGFIGVFIYSVVIITLYSMFGRFVGRYYGCELFFIFMIAQMPMRMRVSLDSVWIRIVFGICLLLIIGKLLYSKSAHPYVNNFSRNVIK